MYRITDTDTTIESSTQLITVHELHEKIFGIFAKGSLPIVFLPQRILKIRQRIKEMEAC